RLEPRRRTPRVPARPLLGPRRHPEGSAGPALRDHDPRVPGAPRGVAALRRGGIAWLPPDGRIRARHRERPAPGHLPRRTALPRLLAPRGGPLVVGRPPAPPAAR